MTLLFAIAGIRTC